MPTTPNTDAARVAERYDDCDCGRHGAQWHYEDGDRHGRGEFMCSECAKARNRNLRHDEYPFTTA